MKNKKFIVFFFLFLTAALYLAGCSYFRRPEAERQPVPDTRMEQSRAENKRPDPEEQPDEQPRMETTEMAERIADIAAKVDGVDRSVVVVISNMALVGITLEREETAAKGEKEIKEEVARQIEDREPSIVNAYVSANPDLVKQLRDISQGIQEGEPISAFFDQITDVLNRMKSESDE